MNDEKLRSKIENLLKFLYSHREDRGIMADLRRGFNEDTQHRAWPHIARFCDLRNPRERKITQLIAAGFATLEESAKSGNFGVTMRQIALGDGKSRDGLNSYEARFRRLLSADSAEELCGFLPGIIRTAKAKNAQLNFFQLYRDLRYWSERVKTEWAAEYWGASKNDKGGDEDDAVS